MNKKACSIIDLGARRSAQMGIKMNYFRIMLKQKLVYRWELIFRVLGTVLYVFLCMYLWRYLYKGNDEMISYMVRYTVLANITGSFYDREIMNFWSDKIKTGDHILALIRPANLFLLGWQQEIAAVLTNLIIRGVPLCFIYLFFSAGDISGKNWLMFSGTLILSHILFVMIYSSIGMLAYIIVEVWPISRFVDDTIRLAGGSFIPLFLLPDSVRRIAEMLPFKYLYSFPLRLLLEEMNVREAAAEIGLMLMWIAVFAICNRTIYQAAMKRAVMNGG